VQLNRWEFSWWSHLQIHHLNPIQTHPETCLAFEKLSMTLTWLRLVETVAQILSWAWA
jgi:hypothetical protein